MSIIKVVAKLEKIMYPKGSYRTDGCFTIASYKPVETIEGEVEVDKFWETFTVKGEKPPVEEGLEYYLEIEEGERHNQFGLSYNLIFMRQNIELDSNDKKSVKNFLKIILTEKQADGLCDTFDDPIAVIEEGDIEKLCQVKGIGNITAQNILDHYDSQKDYSQAYMELGKYDITPDAIRKIVRFYKSPELAIQKVKENPYQLMSMGGYGFKKCDQIFLKMGGSPNAEIRIRSFLEDFLDSEAMNKGNTYISPAELLKNVIEFVPNVDKKLVGKMISTEKDTFFLSDDKKRVSLTKYVKVENRVALNLEGLIKAESNMEFDGWKEVVKEVEEEQGWEFTEQQIEAIEIMLTNNVSILQGFAGTGKSTTVRAVTRILEKNYYSYAQCALSGKASNNLTEVTGRDGHTIHRLLSYDPMSRGFKYNDKNKLPFHTIIVDEFSMVDAQLTMYLTDAIKLGSKVIFIGDVAQLESIGVPIMMPFIESKAIPMITLTKIHRQAQMSAVITDSITIRHGKTPLKSHESVGRFVHGELEDLEYVLVEEDDDIFLETVRDFYKYIQDYDISDIQILTPTRARSEASCESFNNACQKIYNPQIEGKKEVLVGKKITDKEGYETGEIDGYYLRVGDKVINVKNNYKAVDIDGISSPIFNGNIGIIKDIDKDAKDNEYILIDFEGIGEIVVYRDQYRSIQLAYAITVHKSQGSSAEIVIVALPFHYMLNTRQLLYTAITRAKKKGILVARKKNIVSTIKKDDVSNKKTYLAELLRGEDCEDVKRVG